MFQFKILSFVTIFLAGLLVWFHPSLAYAMSDAVLVNPIRGSDFWQNNYSILDTPQKEYQIIQKNNLPATWLVRYDALVDPIAFQFLKSLNNKQEIGLFLEVTPTLTNNSGVSYNQSADWHYAKSILLIGYSPSDRQKMIDTAFSKFQSLFGYYPKSVGAWWIDANSLQYMRDKYQIEGNLDVADQFSTDQYQIWGQYWSSPFYPSKHNAIIPAKDSSQKIGVVTIQWATRDPFNGYGIGDLESTYSVQANDYLRHKLNTNYFKKILDIYPQTTVGLENDFSFNQYGNEYQNQVGVLMDEQSKNQLKISNIRSFVESYQQLHPDIDPTVLIFSDDPLGSNGKVVWYQTTKYRVGWFYGSYGSKIRDLRIYDNGNQESCFDKACDSLNLADSFISSIDDISSTLKNGWVIDEGKISNIKVTPKINQVEITYNNQSGVSRSIIFLEDDINVNGVIKTLSTAILDASTNKPFQTKPLESNFKANFDYNQFFSSESLNFVKFIILTIIFFLLPGWIISRNIWVAIPVGWSLFTMEAYVLGFIKLDKLIWLIPVISLIILVRSRHLPGLRFKVSKQLVSLAALIVVGSTFWLMTVIRSGLSYDYGLGFWGPNGHDAIWHLSLISQLKNSVPPQNPVFAGTMLTNYHYFFDLLLAKSSFLLNIDQLDLLFRFFPLLISILTGVLVYKTVQVISRDYTSSILAVFFVYFGGSFGWILSFIKDGSLGGESLFWAQQSISTLLNPPFAISLVFLFSGLYLFQQFYQNQSKPTLTALISLALLWGGLIEFKAYAGILILISLGLLGLEQLFRKREKHMLVLIIVCGIISLLVFLPNNLSSGSLLIFYPLWFVQTMILFQDRLNWIRLGMIIESENTLKIILGYGLGLMIFILGNFGTRVVGFLTLKVLIKYRILLYISLFGLLIPLLFIQKGTNWNSLQFFYYTLVIFDLFTALTISTLVKRLPKHLSAIFVFIIVFLTIPTAIGTFEQYLPLRPPAKLSTQELEALNFLKQQPSGEVLTLAFDQSFTNKYVEPVPLFAYASTAYVSAFSEHPTFVDDTINLDILGVDYKGRINERNDFLKIPDRQRDILAKNKIRFLYVPEDLHMQFDNGKVGIEEIYKNSQVTIYQVL